MKFTYNVGKEQLIINHEDKMLETYSKIISSYSSLFKQYNCTLEVGLFWNNFLTKKRSNRRLPFRNGYACYIYCEVRRDDKEVRVKSNDGEADYYPLSTTWMVSSMKRNFFKTKVLLYSDTDNTKTDMEELFQLLSDGQ